MGSKVYSIADAGVLGMTVPDTTTNVTSNSIAIVTLKIPSGLSSKAGSTIQVYDYGDGGGWRKAWMSKTRCDMPGGATLPTWPAYLEGSPGVNFYYTIGGTPWRAR